MPKSTVVVNDRRAHFASSFASWQRPLNPSMACRGHKKYFTFSSHPFPAQAVDQSFAVQFQAKWLCLMCEECECQNAMLAGVPSFQKMGRQVCLGCNAEMDTIRHKNDQRKIRPQRRGKGHTGSMNNLMGIGMPCIGLPIFYDEACNVKADA